MSQPTPPSLLKAKLQTIGMAGAAVAVTAGLTMAVTSAPEVIAASDHAIAVKQMQEDVKLAASIGIYPVGPGAQIMRALGMGSPSSALSTLSTIAGFIPGGESISGTLQQISDLLVTLQDGIDIPARLARCPVPAPAATIAASKDPVPDSQITSTPPCGRGITDSTRSGMSSGPGDPIRPAIVSRVRIAPAPSSIRAGPSYSARIGNASEICPPESSLTWQTGSSA